MYIQLVLMGAVEDSISWNCNGMSVYGFVVCWFERESLYGVHALVETH